MLCGQPGRAPESKVGESVPEASFAATKFSEIVLDRPLNCTVLVPDAFFFTVKSSKMVLLSSDDVFLDKSARFRAVEPSSGSNVIPRRARPFLAGLRPRRRHYPHDEERSMAFASRHHGITMLLLRSFRFEFAQHSPMTRPSRRKDCRESIHAFGSRLALQCRGSCRGDEGWLCWGV